MLSTLSLLTIMFSVHSPPDSTDDKKVLEQNTGTYFSTVNYSVARRAVSSANAFNPSITVVEDEMSRTSHEMSKDLELRLSRCY